MPRALLIVDLEATCWEAREHRAEEMETIEIGAVLVEPGADAPARAFQAFVRPVRHPVLSRFCRELTSITQAEVDAAERFPAALVRFLEWIGDPRAVLFASWGEYDARQLQRDCRLHGIAYPIGRHWNLKRAVARELGRKPAGMSTILAELGLALEGTHHRGLDDARNIARIVQVVLGERLGAFLSDEAAPAETPRPSPERLSKFLSLVLRHRAGDFGLAPDGEGFVALSELVAVVERHASPRARREDVLRLLSDPGQRRFERRGERVRACYGHSRSQPVVSYAAVEPPETLYHGTTPAALAHVRREGLRAMGRQYVHLATTRAEAERVGVRRARSPAILTIRARAAYCAGMAFHSPDPDHFLVRSIPPEFIEFPDA